MVPYAAEAFTRTPSLHLRSATSSDASCCTHWGEGGGQVARFLDKTLGGVSKNAGHPDRTLRGAVGAPAEGGSEARSGGRRGPNRGSRRRRKPQRCAERTRLIPFHYSAPHTGARLRRGRHRRAAGARGDGGLGHGRRGAWVHT